MEFELATIDMVIVAVYVVLILGIGFWAGRGKQDSDSYFLAGRNSVWPMIGLSLMAANLSGTSYIGLAGTGYNDGLAVWAFNWMATLVLVFFALFILPFYMRSRISTVPEFLERRYDRRARYAFSAFTVVTAILIDSAGAMYAGAITLQLVFPEPPLFALVVAVALLGGVYVIMGGLSAVEITDTVQGILLLLIGGLLFVLTFQEIGFSWSTMASIAPEQGFTTAPPADDDFLPWPGLITGVLWLSFYYWTTNQVVVQKTLSARSLNHARWGALLAGLTQVLLVLLIFPGIIGREILPQIDNPDQVWPALAFDFLPIGLRGLVLAALVAALMSTLDSVLNGASSLVVNDFIKTRNRQLTERQLLGIGRILVGVFMILAALWAPQITQFPTIVEYFQSFLGYITMPVVTVFLGGLFWKRATPAAGFWTLVVVAPVGLAAFLALEFLPGEFGGFWEQLPSIQFLYGTGIMLVVSLVLFTVVSLLTERPDPAKVTETTWTRQTWRDETEELRGMPAWKNPRFIGIMLVVVTFAAVLPFA